MISQLLSDQLDAVDTAVQRTNRNKGLPKRHGELPVLQLEGPRPALPS